jgi:two-component system, OmpR family, sensor histidine kinase KdpD
MQKAIEQLNTMARSAGVEILFQLPTQDLPQIPGDVAQLQRAFANILENAVKFSTPGSKVEVQFHAAPKNVKIAIADHGSGLEPGEQEKIFEPFYRSNAARNKEGSGLGLFIARRIIESHGGKISAAPNHPTGVILTVELPL